MTILELYLNKVDRNEREDRESQELAERAEPLLARLLPGRNFMNPGQFRDVVIYFLGEASKISAALDAGSFKPGMGYEVIRQPWSNQERLVTASDLARMSGVGRIRITRILNNLKLTVQWDGRKKLYDIDELREVLNGEGIKIP